MRNIHICVFIFSVTVLNYVTFLLQPRLEMKGVNLISMTHPNAPWHKPGLCSIVLQMLFKLYQMFAFVFSSCSSTTSGRMQWVGKPSPPSTQRPARSSVRSQRLTRWERGASRGASGRSGGWGGNIDRKWFWWMKWIVLFFKTNGVVFVCPGRCRQGSEGSTWCLQVGVTMATDGRLSSRPAAQPAGRRNREGHRLPRRESSLKTQSSASHVPPYCVMSSLHLCHMTFLLLLLINSLILFV